MAPAVRRTLGLALLLCGACGQQDSAGSEAGTAPAGASQNAPARPASSSKPVVAMPLVLPDGPPPPQVELAPLAARGTLLQRLPKSALLALRFPHVEKLMEAFERTPVHALMSNPRFGAMDAQMQAGMAQLEAELSNQFADYLALKAKLMNLEGELVFALLAIDAKSFSKQGDDIGGCPVTGAVLFDAGAHAADVEVLVQRGLAWMEEHGKADPSDALRVDLVSSGQDKWHRHLRCKDVAVDFVREGTQFFVHVGPASAMPPLETPLGVRALEESFAAAHIVRATRDLALDGSLPVAEMYLNLDPVWTVVEMFAPAEVKRILESCGATSIHGISGAAGLGKSGIDEVFFIDSPGGKDLITKVFTSRPLDATLARYLPWDSRAATLGTFDLQALYDGICKLLPEAEKRSFEGMLTGLEKQGFDVRKDVIANLGPTFGISGDFDFARMASGDASGLKDLTIVVQLKDASRFQRLIDRALGTSPAADQVHKRTIEGLPTWKLDPVPLPGPGGSVSATIEPSWYVGENAFVLSLSSAALVRSLGSAKEADSRGPLAMKTALETGASGKFSVGTAASAVEGQPAAVTIGRRTSLGLEVITREGTGSTCVASLVGGLGVAASVAIPQLMSSRISTNEAAAQATLQNIASAEQQFRASRLVDMDRDGQGEYGTLAELCGTSGLRSGKPAIQPPLLPSSMTPDADDCFRRSGYVFRIDAARRTTTDIDDQEREFIAYAWPISAGSTGTRVFSIDADGRLLSSDNRGEQQHYQDSERKPPLDASKRSLTGRTLTGVRGRTGRDGGAWTPVE